MSDCVHPCGWYGDSQKPCTCASALVTNYQKRISGPLLDRIDTACRIEVPRVDYEKLSSDRLGESSADMRVAEVRKFCKLDETSESLVRAAMSQLQLSARAYAQHNVIAHEA